MQKLDIRFKKEVLCYSGIAIMVAMFSIYDVFDYFRILVLAYFSLFLLQLIVLRKLEKRILSSVMIIGLAFFIADRITDGEFFSTIRIELIFSLYFMIAAICYAFINRGRLVADIVIIAVSTGIIAGAGSYVYSHKVVRDWNLSRAIKEELLSTYGTDELIERRRLSMEVLYVRYEIKSLEGIEKLENLEKLNIGEGTYLRDFSPIKKLSKLENLDVLHSDVDRISDVGELPNLKYLDYRYCDYGSGVDGWNYPNLKELSLQGGELENLETMRNLDHIEGIDLAYMELDSLKGIEKMTSLKTIRLHSVTIKDTEGLEIPDSVEEIDITGGDIEGLETLKEKYPNIVEYKDKFNFGFE